LYPLSAHSS